MNFIYRGQSYHPSNNIETINLQTRYTYRGQSYQRNYLEVVTTPKAKLTYRGVPYLHTESSSLRNFNPALNSSLENSVI